MRQFSGVADMRLVAVDPGLKPGVVEIDGLTGVVLRASHRLPDWLWVTPWDIAATEGQWYHGGVVDVNNILKLAFRAGFTLACIPAARSLCIPPKVWRSDWGGPGLTKEQVQKRIAKQLTAEERRVFIGIPAARHGDVLDAIGIARAAARLANTTTKWDWKL
jgi:hypothetical protein